MSSMKWCWLPAAISVWHMIPPLINTSIHPFMYNNHYNMLYVLYIKLNSGGWVGYRQALTREMMKHVKWWYITTWLDYCNALLYGLPKKQTKKLPGVQNSATRLVTDTRKYDHITPVLIELHWLPVEKTNCVQNSTFNL